MPDGFFISYDSLMCFAVVLLVQCFIKNSIDFVAGVMIGKPEDEDSILESINA